MHLKIIENYFLICLYIHYKIHLDWGADRGAGLYYLLDAINNVQDYHVPFELQDLINKQ